ncbi:MAG TPA: DUF445 family protein [Bacillales bacterium]|nr:DUF445 family protein [Bacillales bacterium]
MNVWLEILFLIVIGAVIGGVTNSLAIKMLFRPYRPLYIGSWRLPFTPGLIPKRRDELAKQLGKTVMDHLLTPESLQRKLADGDFQEEVLRWARKQAGDFLESKESLEVLLEKHFGVTGLKGQIDGKIDEAVQSVFTEMRESTIEEVLPETWQAKIDEKIPMLAEYIADASVRFVQSPEGRVRIQELTEQFFSGRGMFSNMLQMFLGGGSVAGKIQSELVKLLQQPKFRSMITRFIEFEWAKVRNQSMEKLPMDALAEQVSVFVKEKLPTGYFLETPLADWTAPYRGQVVEKWVPRLVEWAGQTLSRKVEGILQYLHLEDVVKAQVETFAVERLEALVLSISRREFKMITYLGALLGGVIGLIQGIVIQFFA